MQLSKTQSITTCLDSTTIAALVLTTLGNPCTPVGRLISTNEFVHLGDVVTLEFYGNLESILIHDNTEPGSKQLEKAMKIVQQLLEQDIHKEGGESKNEFLSGKKRRRQEKGERERIHSFQAARRVVTTPPNQEIKPQDPAAPPHPLKRTKANGKRVVVRAARSNQQDDWYYRRALLLQARAAQVAHCLPHPSSQVTTRMSTADMPLVEKFPQKCRRKLLFA